MNVLTKVASEWLADSRDECLRCMNDWECLPRKTIVELRVWWPDKRKRDVHNLHKMLADCLEGFVTPDDKYMLIRDMDYAYDRQNPRVEVVARPYDS